ncbi:putative T7SS-secreted protein [Amycolatopsis anabasis]|uniref:putative T7SS-secreted protein n=1 Tax=Amycolatopsis anabasis TaxID=1840409 RepID=UPI001FE7B925|nr:hypothetical protein [Amycolatopsis anabasis]
MTALELDHDFRALGFDPAPGELGKVQEMADKYRTVGRDLAEAKQAIGDIVQKKGVWQGEASEAFARRVGDLPDYLDHATNSMTQAAAALDKWQADLDQMQRFARELETKAREAAEAARQAQQNPDFALANQTFTDQRSLNLAQNLLTHASERLQQAIDACTALQEAAKRLHEQHTHLAEEVAGLLDKARELAPEEPGALEEMVNAVTDMVIGVANELADITEAVWDFVQDNANAIAKMSDVLGDIGNFFGVLGDALPDPAGTVCGAVSTVCGLGALTGHLAAKTAGADVATETLVYDGIGAVAGVVGMIPGMPEEGMKVIGFTIFASQVELEQAGNVYKVPFEGPIGDLKNYWRPNGAWLGAVVNPAAGGAIAFWNAFEQGHQEDVEPERQEKRARDKAWT